MPTCRCVVSVYFSAAALLVFVDFLAVLAFVVFVVFAFVAALAFDVLSDAVFSVLAFAVDAFLFAGVKKLLNAKH